MQKMLEEVRQYWLYKHHPFKPPASTTTKIDPPTPSAYSELCADLNHQLAGRVINSS